MVCELKFNTFATLYDQGRLHSNALDWEGANSGKRREIFHPDRRRQTE